MKKLLLIPVVAAAVLLAGSPASAGGWAVSTLDELPAPAAGEDVTVGYTIRQHGETPVNLDDTGITVRSPDGEATFFAGRQDGPTGHYLATVRFPANGTYTWSVEQGWFGPQPLGTIEVPGGTKAPAPPTKAPAPAPQPVTVRHEPVQLPLAVRLLLPAVALAAGGLALADILHARRAKRQELAAA